MRTLQHGVSFRYIGYGKLQARCECCLVVIALHAKTPTREIFLTSGASDTFVRQRFPFPSDDCRHEISQYKGSCSELAGPPRQERFCSP